MTTQELTLRDLATLYVMVAHLEQETRRVEDYPSIARIGAARPVDITLLWGSAKEPEKGILNKYIAQHTQSLGNPVKSAELVYRSLNKLTEAGLLYNKTEEQRQFIPTRAGIKLYEELRKRGDPESWPDRLPVSAGHPNWNVAYFPLYAQN